MRVHSANTPSISWRRKLRPEHGADCEDEAGSNAANDTAYQQHCEVLRSALNDTSDDANHTGQENGSFPPEKIRGELKSS